jgi:AraC-like DNA-binding protein
MPFTEVGSQSGYQLTTTFYHDFKDRFGITPTEYRKKELKKRLTSDE